MKRNTKLASMLAVLYIISGVFGKLTVNAGNSPEERITETTVGGDAETEPLAGEGGTEPAAGELPAEEGAAEELPEEDGAAEGSAAGEEKDKEMLDKEMPGKKPHAVGEETAEPAESADKENPAESSDEEEADGTPADGEGIEEEADGTLADGEGSEEEADGTLADGEGSGEVPDGTPADGGESGEVPDGTLADGGGSGEVPDGTTADGGGSGEVPDGTLADGGGSGEVPDGTLADGEGIEEEPDGTPVKGEGIGEESDGILADGEGIGEEPDGSPADGEGSKEEPDGILADGEGGQSEKGQPELPDEPPMFSAKVEYSPQGWIVKGLFKDFALDTEIVQPMCSIDGETYHDCGQGWNLQWLGSEEEGVLEKLQGQRCLFGSEEPFRSYLAGELDRFYIKLRIVRQGGIAYESQAAVIGRGEPQPVPAEFDVAAKFAPGMFVREGRPPNIQCYGRYQMTVSEDAAAEEIAAFLPETLPVEIQLQEGSDSAGYIGNDIVECHVEWKPLDLPPLTAGESVTVPDAAEGMVIPAGTVLHTQTGIYQVEEPIGMELGGNEVRLVLNVVAKGEPPEGVLSEENHGLEIAFRLKPTGASAIRAYTFTEGASGWEELTGFPLQDILNAQPLTAGSGYALVLGREQEPYRSYREAKEAGEEPAPFFVGLKIEGGVYDGRQLVLAWPDTYDLPPRLPEVGGSGGNEGNAGADNKGDSTEGGQRPGLDGSGGSDGRGESEGGSRNPGTEEDAGQGGKGDSPGQAQDVAPDGKGDDPEAGQDPGQNGAEAPGGKGDSPETGKNPSQAGAGGLEVKGEGPEAGQDPGQDGAAAPGGKGDSPETGKNPSQTGAGGSEVKGEGPEAGQDPGQDGAAAPGGKGDSPETGKNPSQTGAGGSEVKGDGPEAGQDPGQDGAAAPGGKGDSPETGKNPSQTGAGGSEVKGDGPEAGRSPGQNGVAVPDRKGESLEGGQGLGLAGNMGQSGKENSPEAGQSPALAVNGIPGGERDSAEAGQPSGTDKSPGLGGRGDSTEEGRYIGLPGAQGEEPVPMQGNISGTAGAAPAGHREERLRPDIQEKPASGAGTADKGMAFPAAVGISGLICAGIMAARGAAARKIAGALRGIFLRK